MDSLRIYIAGPYSGTSREQIKKNVDRAIDAGVEIFLKGHFPYVPHLTDLVDARARETGKELTWHDFICWDMPWLRICDALLYLGKSKGSDLEVDEAQRLGKKIFYSINDIPRATSRIGQDAK